MTQITGGAWGDDNPFAPVFDYASARGAYALTVGTPALPGRVFAVICTTAGNVAVQFADGSTLTVPVATGLTLLPFMVAQVLSSGTTATATYANLR